MAQIGNNFNVGRDYSAVLIAPNGARFDFTILTEFDVKPVYKMAECDPLNSPPSKRALPAGHNITFNIERGNNTNDALFLAIEQGWWNVGSADPGTGSNGALTVFITEIDGGTTVQQYAGVSVWLSNAGNVRTDSSIKQSISAFASRRIA